MSKKQVKDNRSGVNNLPLTLELHMIIEPWISDSLGSLQRNPVSGVMKGFRGEAYWMLFKSDSMPPGNSLSYSLHGALSLSVVGGGNKIDPVEGEKLESIVPRDVTELSLKRLCTQICRTDHPPAVCRTVQQTWALYSLFSDNSVTSCLCSRRHPRQPHFLPCHLARWPSHSHHINLNSTFVALTLQNTGPTMAKGIMNWLPPPVRVLPPLCGGCGPWVIGDKRVDLCSAKHQSCQVYNYIMYIL